MRLAIRLCLAGLGVICAAGCASSTPIEPPTVQTRRQDGNAAPTLVEIVYDGTLGSNEIGGALRTPMGLAALSDGTLYVADSGNDRIVRIGANGEFEAALGRFGWREGEFDTPVDVALRTIQRPFLYVAELGNLRIQWCDTVNETYRSVYAEQPDIPFAPMSVAVGRRGELYVTDSRNNTLSRLTADGALEWKRGSLGGGADRFREPRDVAVGLNGYLVVADTGNHRLARYDFSGNYGGAFGRENHFVSPYAVAQDEYGRWFVADLKRGDVSVLNGSGELLTTFRIGDGWSPSGIAVVGSEIVFVSDGRRNLISRFRIVNRDSDRSDGTTPASRKMSRPGM